MDDLTNKKAIINLNKKLPSTSTPQPSQFQVPLDSKTLSRYAYEPKDPFGGGMKRKREGKSTSMHKERSPVFLLVKKENS